MVHSAHSLDWGLMKLGFSFTIFTLFHPKIPLPFNVIFPTLKILGAVLRLESITNDIVEDWA
jgi:hypothetical protein